MISITLSLMPTSEEEAARATEKLARAAAGFAFEGVPATLTVGVYEEELEAEVEVEEPGP